MIKGKHIRSLQNISRFTADVKLESQSVPEPFQKISRGSHGVVLAANDREIKIQFIATNISLVGVTPDLHGMESIICTVKKELFNRFFLVLF